MKTFKKEVDLRSKKAMIEFLSNHFRYHTMNSWNCSTSYANNVKVYKLGLTSEQQDKIYELMETEEFYDEINYMISDFGRDHNYLWQVGFNGRSGGYLVLYQGGQKDSGYKSRCTACGQLNYKTIEETNSCKCGKCKQEARINLTQPLMQTFTYPGKSTDIDEDFEEWDMYSLKKRVKLVQEFDELCDNILAYVVDLCDNCEIEEETIYVPQTKKVIRREG